MSSRRALAVAAGAALGILAVPPVAQAKPFFLDSYSPQMKKDYTPAVKSQRLQANRPYVMTVQGTYSGWSEREIGNRRTPARCGTPEDEPMYRSPGRPNGRVGLDAQFLFAAPVKYCGTQVLPQFGTRFQVAVKRKFSSPDPLGLVTAPRGDHRYRYPILGAGRRARVRLPDPDTFDNYGRLRFVVRAAKPSHCANGQFARWRYADEAACKKAIRARRPKPPTAYAPTPQPLPAPEPTVTPTVTPTP